MSAKELRGKIREWLVSHGLWWVIGGDSLLDSLAHAVKRRIKAMIGTAAVTLILAWLTKLWLALTWQHLALVSLGIFALLMFVWDVSARRRALSAQSRHERTKPTPSEMPQPNAAVISESTESTASLLPAVEAIQSGDAYKSSTESQLVSLGKLTIDFAPSNPELTPNGWSLEKGKNVRVEFRTPINAPCVGCVAIIPTGLYQLTAMLSEHATPCNHLGFSAFFINKEAAVCAWVEIMKPDGTEAHKEKISFKMMGGKAPVKDKDDKWVVSVASTIIGNNWRSFSISLRAAVARSLGTETDRWVFNRLLGISLRGHIDISPFELYETPKIAAEQNSGSHAESETEEYTLHDVIKEQNAIAIGNDMKARFENRSKQRKRNALGDYLAKLEGRIREIHDLGAAGYVRSCGQNDAASQKLVDDIAIFLAENIGHAESALFQSTTGFSYSDKIEQSVSRKPLTLRCETRDPSGQDFWAWRDWQASKEILIHYATQLKDIIKKLD
jgi:hypothetical protein